MDSIDLISYVETLFGTAVGDLGIQPSEFYQMTVREVSLAIKGKDESLERDYNLAMIACVNGNGIIHGGKKFKIIKPFDKEEQKKHVKKKPTKQDRDETLAMIERYKKRNNI